VAVKKLQFVALSRASDHLTDVIASIRPPAPEARKRPALLGEVIGGWSRTTTRLSPALLSTLRILPYFEGERGYIRLTFRARIVLHKGFTIAAAAGRGYFLLFAIKTRHSATRWLTAASFLLCRYRGVKNCNIFVTQN
jgi:hypothetical protein